MAEAKSLLLQNTPKVLRRRRRRHSDGPSQVTFELLLLGTGLWTVALWTLGCQDMDRVIDAVDVDNHFAPWYLREDVTQQPPPHCPLDADCELNSLPPEVNRWIAPACQSGHAGHEHLSSWPREGPLVV